MYILYEEEINMVCHYLNSWVFRVYSYTIVETRSRRLAHCGTSALDSALA